MLWERGSCTAGRTEKPPLDERPKQRDALLEAVLFGGGDGLRGASAGAAQSPLPVRVESGERGAGAREVACIHDRLVRRGLALGQRQERRELLVRHCTTDMAYNN